MDGWLEAPDAREVRRYHRDPESPGRNPTIWIDSGLPITGEPALLGIGLAAGCQSSVRRISTSRCSKRLLRRMRLMAQWGRSLGNKKGGMLPPEYSHQSSLDKVPLTNCPQPFEPIKGLYATGNGTPYRSLEKF
jgi:hypothetical protein